MARSTNALPDGDLCALTWEIPHTFGGLTKSMLQRSCQLATHFGRNVRVLTLAHQPDLDAIRADLTGRGLLVPGVTIENLWEDLLATSDADLTTAPYDPSVSAPVLTSDTDGVHEVCREDGSVLARQQWLRVGTRQALTPDGDQVTRTEIWSGDGRFLGGWRGTWSWWQWWLRRTLEPGSHLIVDSGYVADCLVVAPLPGVPTTYVVHNGHVAAGRDAPYGRLERWRAYAHHHLPAFDAVVYLTETQRDHLQLLRGPQSNVHVVPHAIETTNSGHRTSRSAGAGIVMANIDGRKRVDHAVRAIARAAESNPGIDLHVFGRGAGLEALEAVIRETGAPVTVEGYTSDPASAFAASSFSLLTSTREGFGLVLVEAMAAGSLPISYDIAYGPADIIQDGVDGFLVPAGDVDAMADRIVEVATAPRRRLHGLRRAARRRARAFSPPVVLPRWIAVLESAEVSAGQRGASPLDIDPAELADRERVAALYRLQDCRLEATLLDLTWDGSTATATIACNVEGAGELAGRPTIEAQVLHVPSGSRTDVPTRVVTRADSPATSAPTTTVEVDVDVAMLAEPAHHVVLMNARLGPVEVSDTVVSWASDRPWLDLPPAASQRPVMVIDRRGGLRLVTATPHVAADIRLDADGGVAIDVIALTSDSPVEAVEATGMGGTTSIAARAIGPGSFDLRFGNAGRWKLRARIDGRWRDIAWRGPGNPPNPADGLTVELTARGYVRLHRDV
jgi:poly(glycerol-phosphate) alpha-glucosyltransferase